MALCHGDVVAELLDLMARARISLLAVGWRRRFMSGCARVLKQLVRAMT